MRVSVAVMAHHCRSHLVADLLVRLDRRPVPVAWDLQAASIHREQRWRNGRTAWELHDPAADWHLVIQDDAVPAPDLVAALECHILDHVPERTVISLYTPSAPPGQHRYAATLAAADEHGASWIQRPALQGVAVAVPVPAIDAMLRAGDRRATKPYDKRIGDHFDSIGWRIWSAHPSLVDHRRPDVAPSLVGHDRPDRIRVAHRMHAGSALDWAPDGPVVAAGSVLAVAALPPRHDA